MIDERKYKTIEKRVGKFRIPVQFIRDITNKNILSNLFKNVIVIREEMQFWHNNIEYEAFSEMFDEIEDGLETPYYDVCLRDDDIVFFKKSKEQMVRILPSIIDNRKNSIEERLENI